MIGCFQNRVLPLLFLLSPNFFGLAVAQESATPAPAPISDGNFPEDEAEIDPSNPQNWGIYTREFRREHQFSVGIGTRLSHWEVEGLGDSPAYVGERKGVYEEFQYNFHLHFIRKTGFILGSSVGFQKALRDFEDDRFSPPDDFSLPGIRLGLVYDANPRSRGGLVVNYFLERWNAMRSQNSDGGQTSIHITVEVLDINPFVDFFFDLHWALRLEAHFRQCYFHRPRSPNDTPLDISVRRRDQGYGLGLVYHLL